LLRVHSNSSSRSLMKNVQVQMTVTGCRRPLPLFCLQVSVNLCIRQIKEGNFCSKCCLRFQLRLQTSLSDVTASLSLLLFLSPGPVHSSGLLLHCLLHCQCYFLCAHPPFLFPQTHSLHQFIQRHLLLVRVIACFTIGLRDLSLHRTEHIPSRPAWQTNHLRTHATA